MSDEELARRVKEHLRKILRRSYRGRRT